MTLPSDRVKPKDLTECILKIEQMKKNLVLHRDRQEIATYVGATFLDHIEYLKRDYGLRTMGADYLRWYAAYINRREHLLEPQLL